jgi:hypothetical protein
LPDARPATCSWRRRVEWGIAMCLAVVVLARQLLNLYQRKTAAAHQPPEPSPSPVPSGRHQAWSPSRASVSGQALAAPRADPAFGVPTGTSGGLALLTLQLVAATRPTAPERVQRVSNSVVMTLTSTAAILALWDLSLLIRHAG